MLLQDFEATFIDGEATNVENVIFLAKSPIFVIAIFNIYANFVKY